MKIKSWLRDFQNLLKSKFFSSLNNRELNWWLALFLVPIIIAAFKNSAWAQNITIDSTLNSQQTLNGPDYIIQQSLGKTVNSNLFHSFSKFNLDAGEIALFESAADIRNIFSRVTGNEPSLINGMIATHSNNVNLFFLNPKGILFGPNAQIDIGGNTRGSFVATTLDTLVWPNGEQFSATNPSDTNSLLTLVGDPSGFLSTLTTPKPIEFQSSNLSTNNGQSLLFIGGNIKVNGGEWTAPGGRIELGSVGGKGTVGLNIAGNILSLDFPTDLARADIFTDFSLLDVTGNNGGSIAITSRNIELVNSSRLLAGIAEKSGFVGAQAGDITLNATDSIALKQESLIGNQVNAQGRGNAGNIRLSGRSLSLHDGAQIDSSIFGQGDAGNIKIITTDTITLDGQASTGFGSQITSQIRPRAVGKAGGVEITTKSLSLNDGAEIFANTFGRGDAGNIKITATDTITLDGEDSNGGSGIASQVGYRARGNAGGIEITTKSLSLNNGTYIDASTFGLGDAGNVKIIATDTITLDGENSGGFASAIGSTVQSPVVGKAGGVEITTKSLFLTNGAYIDASTYGLGDAGTVKITATDTITMDGEDSYGFGSAIASQVGAPAVGKAGGVEITTKSLFLTNGAFIDASTFGRGDAGIVKITATDTITLDGVRRNGFGSTISSQVGLRAVGKAGGVEITTNSLSLSNGAKILASTASRDTASIGGDINIATTNLNLTANSQISTQSTGAANAGNIHLSVTQNLAANDSQITASAESAGGGNITINAKNTRLRDRSPITTRIGEGTIGGNININSDIFMALEDSDILATAVRGDGGSIKINSSVFIADIFANGGRGAISGNTDVSTFSGNTRVDISASSQFGTSGTVASPDFTFLQNSLSTLAASFINPEQVVAGSCIARRNVEQSSFTVTGTGGIPVTPYDPTTDSWYAMPVTTSPVATNPANLPQHSTFQRNHQPQVYWKLGDAIAEAQGIVVLADGRKLLGLMPQQLTFKDAEALICD